MPNPPKMILRVGSHAYTGSVDKNAGTQLAALKSLAEGSHGLLELETKKFEFGELITSLSLYEPTKDRKRMIAKLRQDDRGGLQFYENDGLAARVKGDDIAFLALHQLAFRDGLVLRAQYDARLEDVKFSRNVLESVITYREIQPFSAYVRPEDRAMRTLGTQFERARQNLRSMSRSSLVDLGTQTRSAVALFHGNAKPSEQRMRFGGRIFTKDEYAPLTSKFIDENNLIQKNLAFVALQSQPLFGQLIPGSAARTVFLGTSPSTTLPGALPTGFASAAFFMTSMMREISYHTMQQAVPELGVIKAKTVDKSVPKALANAVTISRAPAQPRTKISQVPPAAQLPGSESTMVSQPISIMALLPVAAPLAKSIVVSSIRVSQSLHKPVSTYSPRRHPQLVSRPPYKPLSTSSPRRYPRLAAVGAGAVRSAPKRLARPEGTRARSRAASHTKKLDKTQPLHEGKLSPIRSLDSKRIAREKPARNHLNLHSLSQPRPLKKAKKRTADKKSVAPAARGNKKAKCERHLQPANQIQSRLKKPGQSHRASRISNPPLPALKFKSSGKKPVIQPAPSIKPVRFEAVKVRFPGFAAPVLHKKTMPRTGRAAVELPALHARKPPQRAPVTRLSIKTAPYVENEKRQAAENEERKAA